MYGGSYYGQTYYAGRGSFTPTGIAYTATFNDTITVSDLGISRAITKTLTETVTLSDTISRAITKVFTDTITIVIPVTATLSPGTMADDATVGTIAWTNPDNAKVSDDVYATVFLLDGEVTHYLKATNFGFAIPAGATINGIVAEFEVKSSSSVTTHASDSRIVKSGVIGTTNKGTGAYLSTIEAYISYGNSTDLWGEIWSPSDINASDFGFVLSLNRTASGAGSTASVDHIRITVYYTVPDYITTSKARGKIFNDVITITDSITRAITKTLTETITLSDNIIRGLTRVFTDTTTLSETFSNIKSSFITFTDTLTLSETFSKAITRVFTDTATITETFSKAKGYVIAFTDTITITDTITRAVTKAFSETVTLSDSIRRYLNGELITKWIRKSKTATTAWSNLTKLAASWTQKNKTESTDWTKKEKTEQI